MLSLSADSTSGGGGGGGGGGRPSLSADSTSEGGGGGGGELSLSKRDRSLRSPPGYGPQRGGPSRWAKYESTKGRKAP